MADDARLPKSSMCRRLPVAFIAGSLSDMTVRHSAAPVPAKKAIYDTIAAIARSQHHMDSGP